MVRATRSVPLDLQRREAEPLDGLGEHAGAACLRGRQVLQLPARELSVEEQLRPRLSLGLDGASSDHPLLHLARCSPLAVPWRWDTSTGGSTTCRSNRSNTGLFSLFAVDLPALRRAGAAARLLPREPARAGVDRGHEQRSGREGGPASRPTDGDLRRRAAGAGTSSTGRRNSSSSSRNRHPWWASETSPGRAGSPPPHEPGGAHRVVRSAEGPRAREDPARA
jgi:hypothetical protein